MSEYQPYPKLSFEPHRIDGTVPPLGAFGSLPPVNSDAFWGFPPGSVTMLEPVQESDCVWTIRLRCDSKTGG